MAEGVGLGLVPATFWEGATWEVWALICGVAWSFAWASYRTMLWHAYDQWLVVKQPYFTVPCSTLGSAIGLSIDLNAQVLEKALRNMKSDEVIIAGKSDESPVVLAPEDPKGTALLVVAMPLRTLKA